MINQNTITNKNKPALPIKNHITHQNTNQTDHHSLIGDNNQAHRTDQIKTAVYHTATTAIINKTATNHQTKDHTPSHQSDHHITNHITDHKNTLHLDHKVETNHLTHNKNNFQDFCQE